MSLLGGIGKAIMNGIPGSDYRTENDANAQQKQLDVQKAQQQNEEEFAQHMLDLKALPVVSGAVKRTLNLPDGRTIEGGLLDKADPTRTISHKTIDGRTVQFELPSAEEQIGTHAKRLMQQFTEGQPQREAANTEAATQAGRVAKSTAAGTGAGQLQSDQAKRQAEGIQAPGVVSEQFPDAAKNPDGSPRLLLPKELTDLTTSADNALTTRYKVLAARRQKAAQDISGVNSQEEYDAWKKKNPEEAATEAATYNPNFVDSYIRRAVPIEQQPQYDIKRKEALWMSNMTPKSLGDYVDAVVPPGVNPALNQRTKEQAMRAPTYEAVQALVKGAGDELGKTESAVATAKATAPIKINVAAATDQVRNNNAMGLPGQNGGPGAPQANGQPAAPLTGEDYVSTLPSGFRDKVRGILGGGVTAPTGRAATSGPGAILMNAVMKADPQWSEQRAQIRKAFTAGADGKNIGALNTATVHLDQLAEAATAMQNGSFRPGNQLYNSVSTMLGGAAPTNFEGIKAAVSGEMASALKGTATDEEIKTIKATIDSSASPEQLQGAVSTGLHVLGAKLNTYQERYSQQIPNDTAWSPVLPSAKAVFSKHGINPTAGPASVKTPGQGFSVTAPDGSVHTFPDQGKADAFRKAVGGR